VAYVQRVPVRFEDVDFARVVYFPRLFGYCHNVFEDFFAKELGQTYSQVLTDRKVGFPSVHAEADFRAPLRFGDVCRVVMETVKVSSRSITSRYQLYRGETDLLCARVEIVTAGIKMDDFTPTDIPEDVKEVFRKHQT
jgi:4-hydroxybenzoyl-CoA thioesterase